ncbi:MAG: hypothetical protein M3384_16350 [Acidobacteriota bacterium]|nr:hypothetical protein [Acidobacteriota bacterium]
MKKNLLLIFAVATLFSLTGGISAQNKKPVPREVRGGIGRTSAAPSSTQTDFLGGFDANIYKNKFFGVKITVPEKWVIHESEVNKAIKQRGSEVIKGKTEEVDKALEASAQRVTLLFTTSKDIFGMENNAIMVFAVEKGPGLTHFRNGDDYLRMNLQSLKKLDLPPDFKYSEKINSEKLGNETFYYLDMQRNGFRQRGYATARKGYALFFTLSFVTDEDLEMMKDIIRNSDFSWKE